MINRLNSDENVAVTELRVGTVHNIQAVITAGNHVFETIENILVEITTLKFGENILIKVMFSIRNSCFP